MDELEQQIHRDLDGALAQVKNTIQADCRVMYIEATDFGELAVDVAVGENCGLAQWDFPLLDRLVPVASVRHYFDCDLELYLSDDHEALQQFWTTVVDELTRIFFERNPEYKIAIQR